MKTDLTTHSRTPRPNLLSPFNWNQSLLPLIVALPSAQYIYWGTLPRFSRQVSQLSICYYRQDLFFRPFQLLSLAEVFKKWPEYPPTLENSQSYFVLKVEYRYNAWALSIFRAFSLGEWVVTHSLEDIQLPWPLPRCLNEKTPFVGSSLALILAP